MKDVPVTWVQLGYVAVVALVVAAGIALGFRLKFKRWPW